MPKSKYTIVLPRPAVVPEWTNGDDPGLTEAERRALEAMPEFAALASKIREPRRGAE